MSENIKTYDAYGNEINISSDDFKLVHSTEKIADEKFQTKTTTFAKDAFKRFCKNKSSVAGAIIIGVLLILSIFVPWISGRDVSSTTYPEQALLPPKLFGAGAGWWDGTKHYKNQVYDYEIEQVSGGMFKNECIVENTLVISDMQKINSAVEGAHGGTMLLIQIPSYTSSDNLENNLFRYQTGTAVALSKNESLTMEVKFNSVESTCTDYGSIDKTKYKFYVYDETTKNYYYGSSNLNDATGTATFDIKKTLVDNNVETIEKAKIGLAVLPKAGETAAYIGIDSIVFNTNGVNETSKASLDKLSFTDANAQVLLNVSSSGATPEEYWQPFNATRKTYAANIKYASFDYDEYKNKLGEKNIEIPLEKLNEWKENKYYIEENVVETVDQNGAKIVTSTIKVLDDKCPLVDGAKLVRQSLSLWQKDENGKWGWKNLDVYKGDVYLYKYNGYSSMPSFVFGTTDAGYDLFTLAFFSLRTSLLLAVVVFAVNFTIGLVWGSISGYFGGNTDLIMERIIDILNGMPFIVVVTLCILHLGNNVVTFAIALCLTGWIGTASRTRTQFYRYKGREYVLASRTLGASDTRLIFKHVLPNALGTIVTGAVLMIPSVIFSEATLAYLNLGLQGSASFGVLLSNNQQYLSSYPMLIVFPAIIISLLMISFNLFGNGLRDALNPSLKGSE